MDTDSHAVRWATNEAEVMYLKKYTKWHYTLDATFTICGRLIVVGGNGGRFLPETDDEVSRVDCKQCLRVLNGHH